MRKYRKWVLTLGIMAATPGIVSAANPLAKFFGKTSGTTTASARTASASRQPSSRAVNQRVAENIALALRSAKLNGYEMEVEFSKGVCTLTGKIGSAAQKAKATSVVRSVRGVLQVDNRLQVIGGSRSPFGGTRGVRQAGFNSSKRGGGVRRIGYDSPAARGGAIQNNQKMAESIAKSLSKAGLSGYDIEIRYQNGAVMLIGAVSSSQQKMRAEQVVKQIPGIRQVHNRLVVGEQAGPQRPNRQPFPRRPIVPASAAYPQPMPAPQGYSHGGPGAQQMVYNQANLPATSWPSYAAYPNYAQVAYPKQYSASAWPYIGPFYPYPQVPLGWRQVQLEWDDGYWNLNFRSRTDRWWWFLNPKNW
ncbi:MAG: BON domain-containing protein [Planctomycetaceae bacterium]